MGGIPATTAFAISRHTGSSGPEWFPAGWFGNLLLWLAAGLTLVTGYAYLKTGWKHLSEGN